MEMKEPVLPFSARQWLYSLGIIAVGLLLYAAILIIGVPGKISQIVLSEDAILFFLGSFIFLYFAYLPSGWRGILTSFAATLALFAVQLSGIWRSGLNLSAFVLSGLLTLTDTAGYYSSALNFLEGGQFWDIAAWRPLAHGVLATLLKLTQQNWQLTLALLVLITAIACFLLAREVQRSHGTAAAVIVLLISFMYYRVYLGTASTESLGIALGALGLAFIWRGAAKYQINSCLFGIFLLTLALNTRAGTFFILPALIIWGAWQFRGTARFSVRFILGGFSLVFLGFALNSLIFKLTSPPDVTSFSNFSYSLYGLLVNGNWLTIYKQHPEVFELSDQDKAQRIYQIIFEILRKNPFSLVQGCWRAWKMFVWDDFVFAFVATAEDNSAKLNIGLQILSLMGLFSLYRQRLTPIGSMLLAATLGILLSVPFVPPWDAGMRPYMATVPFIAVLPALGFTALVRKMEWRKLQQLPVVKESPILLWFVGGALVFLTIGGTIITKALSYPPNFAKITCPAGTEAVYFRNTAGSSLKIVPDKAIAQTNVPKVRLSDFKGMLNRYEQRYGRQNGATPLLETLSDLSAPITLTSKINLEDGELLWVVRQNPIHHEGIIGTCGTFAAERNSKNLDEGYLKFIFYADSETPL